MVVIEGSWSEVHWTAIVNQLLGPQAKEICISLPATPDDKALARALVQNELAKLDAARPELVAASKAKLAASNTLVRTEPEPEEPEEDCA